MLIHSLTNAKLRDENPMPLSNLPKLGTDKSPHKRSESTICIHDIGGWLATWAPYSNLPAPNSPPTTLLRPSTARNFLCSLRFSASSTALRRSFSRAR